VVCTTPTASTTSLVLCYSSIMETHTVSTVIHTPVGPQASPDPLPALATSLAPFALRFRRSTSRERVERSVTGLLTDRPRKNCDTIAAAVAGPSTERRQPLLTDATWDPQGLDRHLVTARAAQRPPQGILRRDDTGLSQQGRGAVGVVRQYAGTLGQGAPCQGVVNAPDVADEPTRSAPRHWPLTAQLSRPEVWATEQARRARGQVPPTDTLQTKPTLALTLVDPARVWDVPFAGVVTDAGSGDTPACLAGLDARQVADVVGGSRPLGGRLPDERRAAAAVPPASRGGASPSRRGRRRGPPRRPCGMRSRRRTGRRAPGASTRAAAGGNSCWPDGGPGPRAGRRAPRAMRGWRPGQRAGGSASVPSRATAGRSNGIAGPCRRTRGGIGGSSWPTAAGRWSNATQTPRASGAWPRTRAGAGRAGIGLSHGSCWPTVFWPVHAGSPLRRRALPPSEERPSFPAVHRQVLGWLFQDVVLWLIATNQMTHFRPRRN
jgi:DDE superfamily endonuclease